MNTATETTATVVVAAKNAGYIVAFMAGVEYLGLAPVSVVALLILMISDIILGILKSASLHGPQSIKSSLLSRGVLAKALVIAIPMNVAIAGKGVGFDLSALAQGTITVLILSELYSVLGNIYAIRTGTERVEFDAVAYVIKSIRNLLRKFIED